MPPDFLNSREDALLIWGALFVIYALAKEPRGIGRAVYGVVRALVHPKMILLFGGAAAYTTALVLGADRVGAWEPAATKVTVYWFLGTAVVFAGNAVQAGASGDRAISRDVLRRVLAVTVLIEFLVGVYAMPLAVELPAALIVLLFTGMQVVAQRPALADEVTRRVIAWVLGLVGIMYLTNFVATVASNPSGFATWIHADELLVPPLLSLAFIPYLLLAQWRAKAEQRRFRTQYEF